MRPDLFLVPRRKRSGFACAMITGQIAETAKNTNESLDAGTEDFSLSKYEMSHMLHNQAFRTVFMQLILQSLPVPEEITTGPLPSVNAPMPSGSSS